ncbi:MAG: hypothetical protein KDA33_17395 [Phycisphaerales bacterium]|nr:hypothetical protein [Phycisphaerales bacterium]
MADSNYVIVHCPKGHELQAAHEHLTATLSCPVCGIEFVPQSSGPAAGMAPPSRPDSAGLSYAGGTLAKPVEYPGITTAMLWLFLMSSIFMLAGTILSFLMKDTLIAIQSGSTDQMAKAVPIGAAACVGSVCWLVAIVLQLIWVYRIHTDAQQAGGYEEVSPGLAIGLTFIPWFNYIWTGIAMRKLARFADGSRGPGAAATGVSAVAATTRCLYAGILLGVGNFSVAMYNGVKQMSAMQAAMSNSGKPTPEQLAEQYGGSSMSITIGAAALSLVCVLVYFASVRKLEASLYPALGAPAK